MSVVPDDQGSHEANERESLLKWNGWGFQDSYFYLDEKNDVTFSGQRYDISGKCLPNLRPWMEENIGIDVNYKTPSQAQVSLNSIVAIVNSAFQGDLLSANIEFSTDPTLRLHRSHGHTCHDVTRLRSGTFERIVDLVVWPKNEKEVELIVERANEHNVCLIPIGGGTTVTSALECPENETRSIVSVDMCKMSRLLWVDRDTMTARAEAGIIGRHLEELLASRGYALGHEPDSVEFSSLGGWVATRASGMKKNRYGNIEDIVIHVNMVTPKGTLKKYCSIPRISAGPDIHQIILGSEGTLGIITEVTFKIWHKPECKKYGSVLFPSFELGVKCLREVARQRCAPVSIRLVDNEQFRFGQALKPEVASYSKMISDYVKKFYVTKWKGFEVYQMCAATLVFEGTKQEVEDHEKRIYGIAKNFQGMPAGEENGRYGYMLTYAIAYLRDLGFEYSALGESFETSVPYDKVLTLCNNVKRLLHNESKRKGVLYPVFASCRVTQLYDSGACVYFYFGFNHRGMNADPVHVYEEIETAARDEIIACGGSISHHHGIGKIRRKWLPETVSSVGISLLRAVKQELDPNNIFASGNIFTVAKL